MKKYNTSDKIVMITSNSIVRFLSILFFLIGFSAQSYAKGKRAVSSIKTTTQSYILASGMRNPSRKVASTNEMKKTDYPPPPADKKKLPRVVLKNIKAIEDLCKLDSLEKQVPQLKKALNELRKAIPFYNEHYFKQVNPVILNEIYFNLFDDAGIAIYWRYLNTEQRVDMADQFLSQRIRMYNLREYNNGPDHFRRDWEHKIYKGLHCYSTGHPPKQKR